MNRAISRILNAHDKSVRNIILTMQEGSVRSQKLENAAFQDVFENTDEHPDFEYRKGISGKVKS